VDGLICKGEVPYSVAAWNGRDKRGFKLLRVLGNAGHVLEPCLGLGWVNGMRRTKMS
jgi:hypothetical protein